MVLLELQYFEIMDRNFTAIEARVYIGGICSRIYRNFDALNDTKERYGNQMERFELRDEATAVAFIESNPDYAAVEWRGTKGSGEPQSPPPRSERGRRP